MKHLMTATDLAEFCGTSPANISRIMKKNPERLPKPIPVNMGKTPRWLDETVFQFFGRTTAADCPQQNATEPIL